jgi:hypothetical protein
LEEAAMTDIKTILCVEDKSLTHLAEAKTLEQVSYKLVAVSNDRKPVNKVKRTADYLLFLIEWSLNNLNKLIDASGQIARFIVIVQNITCLKKGISGQ